MQRVIKNWILERGGNKDIIVNYFQYKNRLDQYLQNYDIVIYGDGNFTKVHEILSEILDLPKPEIPQIPINTPL